MRFIHVQDCFRITLNPRIRMIMIHTNGINLHFERAEQVQTNYLKINWSLVPNVRLHAASSSDVLNERQS